MEPQTVVIVGGGFGGLSAAKELAGEPEVQVFLIDQRNHHLFQPLLYQVATAGLNPGDIAVPIRGEFANASNIEVHLGRVDAVDLERREIRAQGRHVPYDTLILACGAQHSYFGKSDWEEFAPGLKTLEQATEIRRRVLMAFENAENEEDPSRFQEWLTFVVVGGGPTGVELAGALAEISRDVLVRDFRRIDPRKTRIVLVEAGRRVLASFTEGLSARALRDLRSLGVEVRLEGRVTQVSAEGVVIGGAERIAARTVIWAAGVQASSLGKTLGAKQDAAGRVYVQPDLSLPGHPEVFVIGDQARFEPGSSGTPLPGLAPVALQQGRHAAKNVLRRVRGKKTLEFRYFDKGQMATIGKVRAVVQFGKARLSGWIAWIAWLFVHLYFLVGFKNRFSVFGQWAWSYVFSKRGARLITRPDWRSKPISARSPEGRAEHPTQPRS